MVMQRGSVHCGEEVVSRLVRTTRWHKNMSQDLNGTDVFCVSYVELRGFPGNQVIHQLDLEIYFLIAE